MIERKCLQCNLPFETYLYNLKIGSGKFCSQKCHMTWRKGKSVNWNERSRRPKKIKLTQLVFKFPRISPKRKYGWFFCQVCNKKFYPREVKTSTKYCSLQCYWSTLSEKMSGSKNPTWKDGRQANKPNARAIFGYGKWSKSVKIRDNYTCRLCGIKDIKLHAHHLFSFAGYPDKRTDINNGVTLCENCHHWVHRICDNSGKEIAYA